MLKELLQARSVETRGDRRGRRRWKQGVECSKRGWKVEPEKWSYMQREHLSKLWRAEEQEVVDGFWVSTKEEHSQKLLSRPSALHVFI
jgi:hypothetical protein